MFAPFDKAFGFLPLLAFTVEHRRVGKWYFQQCFVFDMCSYVFMCFVIFIFSVEQRVGVIILNCVSFSFFMVTRLYFSVFSCIFYFYFSGKLCFFTRFLLLL